MAFIVILNGFILAYAAQLAMVEIKNLQNRFDRVTAASNSETQKLRKRLETVQSQLKLMSAKLNEVENRREPIVAFRVTGIKMYPRNLPGKTEIT